MLKYFSVLFFVLFLSIEANATQGCVDANRTRIYTSFQNGQGYWRTSTFSSTSAPCFYVYSGGVCSIGSANANNGFLGDDAVAQECPIDDYAWVLIIGAGGIGYLLIRKRSAYQIPA